MHYSCYVTAICRQRTNCHVALNTNIKQIYTYLIHFKYFIIFCYYLSFPFQANEAYLRFYPQNGKNGVRKLGLSFPLSSNHFVISNGNRVQLKCLASISEFYWKSAKITLLQEKPKFASVMTSGEEAVSSQAAEVAAGKLLYICCVEKSCIAYIVKNISFGGGKVCLLNIKMNTRPCCKPKIGLYIYAHIHQYYICIYIYICRHSYLSYTLPKLPFPQNEFCK